MSRASLAPLSSRARSGRLRSKRALLVSTRHSKPSGYTIIELVMAMAVFAIGVTGIAAMQSATTASNRHAKNIAVASAIAKTWQEELAVDATRWTAVNTAIGLANTNWVRLFTDDDGAWFLPDTVGTMGASFDALGNFTANASDVVFCTHLRLTRLIQSEGSQLVRAQVRVFWPKHGHDWETNNYCTPGAGTNLRNYVPGSNDPTATEFDNFHFVYSTSAIRQSPAP